MKELSMRYGISTPFILHHPSPWFQSICKYHVQYKCQNILGWEFLVLKGKYHWLEIHWIGFSLPSGILVFKEQSSVVSQLAIQRSVYTHLVISSWASFSWHIVNSYSCGTVMASSNLSKTESHLPLGLFCESSKFNILVHNICNKWTKVDTMHSRVWGISALMNACLHRDLAKVWLEVHMKSVSNLHYHRRQKHFIKYPILKIMDQSIIVSSSLE